jgi:hypothetical protein
MPKRLLPSTIIWHAPRLLNSRRGLRHHHGSKKRGLADLEEALNEAAFVVLSCSPEIIKLGLLLQAHYDLTFPEVSALLDWENGRCIYTDY